ncbi:PH domain-containing protein [Sporosarcina sp. GW1-11]|uniref:PH domain-containing protein n=1 Tax=Sporosarcina sp. GW1-11 TaxID=2899126 RepID=UPI00294BEC1C|nr:PH domain-containing protein [Sporosarcina sp. GW1-11]MDV6378511.1 PH domain-containing protein [Sporosarcina sp. GW1-11]
MNCVIAFQCSQGWRKTMSEQRYKLHWITAVVETVKALKDLIGPFIVVVVVNGFKSESSGPWYFQYWSAILFSILLISILVSGIIKWRRFDYWFEDQELRIESGLFVRKKRYIPFDRIQSLDYTEGIFHRPLQLVKVKVETAGSSSGKDAEAELTAITKEAAGRIEEEIQRAKKMKMKIIGPVLQQNEELVLVKKLEELVEHPASAPVKFTMKTKDLLVLATTSSGIGVILSGAFVFLSQIEELIPFDWLFGELESFVKFGVFVIGIMIVLGLLLVWLLSVVMTFVANYDFKVALDKNDLVITRGLLEKKRVTIPLNRVQNITIAENPFRQLFGYATVILNSAGGTGESSRIKLFPLAKRDRVIEPLQELFPNVDFSEPSEKIGKRGKYFYYRLKLFITFLIVVAVSYYLFPYGLFASLLLPVVFTHGIWQYKTAAYAIMPKQLTMRYRGISRHTVFTVKDRIQSMEIDQNYFHRRKKVATLTINVKSGMSLDAPAIRHMSEEKAEQFLEWYEYHPESKE